MGLPLSVIYASAPFSASKASPATRISQVFAPSVMQSDWEPEQIRSELVRKATVTSESALAELGLSDAFLAPACSWNTVDVRVLHIQLGTTSTQEKLPPTLSVDIDFCERDNGSLTPNRVMSFDISADNPEENIGLFVVIAARSDDTELIFPSVAVVSKLESNSSSSLKVEVKGNLPTSFTTTVRNVFPGSSRWNEFAKLHGV